MKIHCDVCSTAPATLMCCADDAALCYECDTRVHAANKLANKHQRVPLLIPDPDNPGTRCDICQEKAGYFFCLEDRALLCRTCDVSIHSTNIFASKHKRYLVTGIRVGLQAISGKDCAQSDEIARVRSQSTQSGSAGNGSPVFNVTSQSSVPVSQRPTSSLHSPSAMHQTRSTKSSTQRASRVWVSAAATKQASYASVVPTTVLGDSPVAGSRPAEKIPLSSRSSVIEDSRSESMISSEHSRHEGLIRKNSVSEYFSESISGWKLDELLNLSDAARMGNLKRNIHNFEDVDWNSDFSDIDERLFGESLAEVPSLPSPAAASGAQSTGKFAGSWKGKRATDLTDLFGYGDFLVVPESDFPSPPPQKRRVTFLET